MALTRRSPSCLRSCRFSLFLSLSLHGLLAIVLCFWPFGGNEAKVSAVVVDTRVFAPGPGIEVTLVLGEPPRPIARSQVAGVVRRAELPGKPGKSMAQGQPTGPEDHPRLDQGPRNRQTRAAQPLPGTSGPGGDLPGPRRLERVVAGGRGPTDSEVQPFGPGAQTTSFFQIGTAARIVVYVIDRSASMGLNGAFALAKRELSASLERLHPNCAFQIILYNRFAEPLHLGGRAELLPATSANKIQAARYVQALAAEGGTDHLSALRRALALHPDVVYLLTDAADMTAEQIQSVTVWNQGRAVIHTVELAPGRHGGDSILAVLARRNGGIHRALVSEPSLSFVHH